MSMDTPVIPSEEFVTAANAAALANGQPFRSALDPLMMLAWSLANTPPPGPFVTGLPAI